MTDKTDTALADKVRQFRSNAPKLDMASLARAKQVADETLFYTGAGGKALSPETAATAILAPSPAPDAPYDAAQKAETILAVAHANSHSSIVRASSEATEPATPASRIAVTLRMDADLHMELKYAALKNRISLSDLVSAACRAKLAAGN